MKKFYHIFSVASLLVLLLNGCTLTLDEYPQRSEDIPEESRGVYEPYTVHTDYLDLTYQLNDGVKLVTENVMKYYVKTEADTILYFMDNIPDEWLADVDGCLEIGVNTQFPIGYAGKVLERTHENGMYRFVTTRASLNDIFKELEYVSDIVNPDMSVPEDYNYDAGDSALVMVDYSLCADEVPELYEKQKAPRWAERAKARAERKRAMQTRASGWVENGVNDEDNVDRDSIGEKDVFQFSFDTELNFEVSWTSNGEEKKVGGAILSSESKDAAKKTVSKFMKAVEALGLSPYFSFTYKKESSTVFHCEYSKRKEYQETSQTETATTSYSIDFGVKGGNGASKDLLKKKIAKQMLKKGTSGVTTTGKSPFALYRTTKLITIFPPLGLFLKFSPEVGAEFEFQLCGQVSREQKTVTKTGSYQKGDDNAKPIDQVTKYPPNWDFGFSGKLSADVYFKLEAGLSLGTVVDFNVVPKIAFGFEISRSPALYVNEDKNDDEYFSFDTYVEPILSIGIDAEVAVSMGKKKLSLASEPILKPRNFFDKAYWFPPYSMKSTILNASLGDDVSSYQNESEYNLTADFTFTGEGMAPRSTTRFTPLLRVYQTDMTGFFNPEEFEFYRDCIIEMPATNNPGSGFKKDFKYKFASKINKVEGAGKSIMVVPVLFDKESDSYVVYRDMARRLESGVGEVLFDGMIQTEARNPRYQRTNSDPNDFKDFGIKGNLWQKMHLYWWEDLLYISKGTKIQEVGFSTVIKNKDGKVYFDNTKNPKRFKSTDYHFGTGYYRFCQRYGTDHQDDVAITVTPYYINDQGRKIILESKVLELDFPMAKRSSGFPGAKVNN